MRNDARKGLGRWAVAILCMAAVAGLYLFMVRVKITTLRGSPVFDPADDTGLFWTENAFHYRYAKMAALGPGIPDLDVRMQAPEGMRVTRDEMPMMERFAGWLYRHQPGARGRPFHVFLMELVCRYSSLLVFPAFALAWYLWRSPLAGLAASLFYIFTHSYFGGVVLGAYVRQDFALPFLFTAAALLIAGIERESWAVRAAGAAVLAFALVSWHLSQFFLLVFLGGAVCLYFLQPGARPGVARTLGATAAVLLAAALVSPPLRSGRFPVSLAMLVVYALLGQHVLVRGPQPAWKRIAAFLLLFAAMAGALAVASRGHYGRYSHVYALMLDKIRFLGVKPADPSRMTGFESRVMWTSSFLSPPLREMAVWLGPAWIAGAWGCAAAAAAAVRARALRPGVFLAFWMAAAFVILFALIRRMDVFAGFFVCVLAGAAWPRRLDGRGRVSAAVLLVLVYAGYRNLTALYMVSENPPARQLAPLLAAIRENTGPDDVILASFPLSPVICAYTERPVVIHSKFENRRVREKIEEFYLSLFGPEEPFHAFCRAYGVRWFVYEPVMLLNRSPESIRYTADRLVVDRTCAASLMNFLPEALRRFQLVHQTDAYRIFRVLEEGEAPAPAKVPRLPVYDSRSFRQEDLGIR